MQVPEDINGAGVVTHVNHMITLVKTGRGKREERRDLNRRPFIHALTLVRCFGGKHLFGLSFFDLQVAKKPRDCSDSEDRRGRNKVGIDDNGD